VTRLRAHGRPTLVVALLAALVAFVGASSALARTGALLVHQCVADGTAGAIGLRLALLRQDAACPGQLAIGGEPREVIGVVVLVAVPVLLAHLVGVLAGLGMLARVRAGVRTVARVLSGLLRRPEPVALHVAARQLAPVARREAAPRGPALTVRPLRGPPLAIA
jgi:hypothetical protein